MTGLLSDWAAALCGSAAFCAVAWALCPKCRARQVLSLACGCVMLMALLSPMAEVDASSIGKAAARARQAASETVTGAENAANELTRSVIAGECEAYILDRAERLGLAPADADVTLRWSGEGFWYPWSCTVGCPHSDRLAEIIESELGIARDRQSWEAN